MTHYSPHVVLISTSHTCKLAVDNQQLQIYAFVRNGRVSEGVDLLT